MTTMAPNTPHVRQRTNFFLADPADAPLVVRTDLSDSETKRRDAVVRGLVGLIVSSTVLVALGIVMVFSATSARSIGAIASDSSSAALFSVAIRQAMWAGIGLFFCLVLCFFPYRFVERLSYWLLALGIGLQVAVLFVGKSVSGNNNWLVIGQVQIQPSEFLKLAMVVWLAHSLARLQLDEIRTARTLLIPVLGFGVSAAGVLGGGDMGTAIIFVLIGGGMLWLAGLRNSYLVFVGLVGAFGAAILVAIQPSRLRRVTDYVENFFATPDIYEPTQSEFAQFAFGSGGLAGVGLGASKEKWRDLAEAHTDFIFAIIGEELGFFGTVTVVVLFLALGWSFVQIAVHMPTRYGQLVVSGAALWICGQGIINMSVVAGLLPVFGVPLPFLSQGGSSMMAVLMMIGVVIGCARAVPGVKEAFAWRSRFVARSKAVMKGSAHA